MSSQVELSEVKADLKDVEAGDAKKSASPDDACTIVEHMLSPEEIQKKLDVDFKKGLSTAGT